jgi:hypothetical protein
VAVNYTQGTVPSPPDNGGEAPPQFASGSGGIRNFGRGTLAILHGREAVLTETQLRGLSARTAPSQINVTLELNGAALARKMIRLTPDALGLYGVR